MNNPFTKFIQRAIFVLFVLAICVPGASIAAKPLETDSTLTLGTPSYNAIINAGGYTASISCHVTGGVVYCTGTTTITDNSPLLNNEVRFYIPVTDTSSSYDFYASYYSSGSANTRISPGDGAWYSVPKAGSWQVLNNAFAGITITIKFDESSQGIFTDNFQLSISSAGYVNPIEPPSANCSDAYTDSAVIASLWNIDPRIEFPNGPDAVSPLVPDQQKIGITPLTIGDPNLASAMAEPHVFHLSVDGLWNTSRSDYAYSFDGTTYYPLSLLPVLCSTPNNWWFQITTEQYFYIRANDSAGAFADNTPNTAPFPTWSLALSSTSTQKCTDQFTYNPATDLITTLSIPANLQGGVYTADGDITIGSWYVMETTNGPWHNGSDPTAQYAIQGEWPVADWWDFSSGVARGVECMETTADGLHTRIYVQAPVSMFYARVKDSGGNFADNTGTMGLNIYSATFTRFRTPCESHFKQDQTLRIMDIDVQAPDGTFVNSIAMPDELVPGVTGTVTLIPGQAYQIVTTKGPWYYRGVGHGDMKMDNYDLQIQDNSGEWKDLDTWDGADCIAPLDQLGHLSVYFTVPDSDYGADYRLRVNDTSFSGNTGSMGFILFSTMVDSVPPGVSCTDYSYDPVADLLYSVNVLASKEAGEPMMTATLTYGNIYAIKITNGPWHEASGGADEWGMQIKSAGGNNWNDPANTWYDLMDWPYTLCPDVNGHDYTVFFKAEYGQGGINVRADSTTFSNNTGSRTASLYNVSHENGPVCFFGKEKYQLFEEPHVNEKADMGNFIGHPNTQPGLAPGIVYGIETKNNWFDNGVQSDKLEVSSDGGASWYEIKDHPNVNCANYVMGQTIAEFNVNIGEVWRIRVKDGDDNWFNNTGAEGYIIYEVDDPNNPLTEPPGPFPNVPAEPWLGQWAGAACDATISRPQFDGIMPTFTSPAPMTSSDIFDLGNYLGEWVSAVVAYLGGWFTAFSNVGMIVSSYTEYASMSVQQYFAWCDRHTQAIVAMPGLFYTVEPFGSMKELAEVGDETQQAINGYGSGGENVDMLKPQSVLMPSGGQTAQIINILTSLPASSPYNNGKISIRDTGARVYATDCNKSLTPAIGTKLGAGICFGADMMVTTGVSIWMQLIFELSILVMFVLYIFKTWILKIQQ
jgi:hypothetical protein